MSIKLKTGDLVRIIPEDGWETSEFGWDGDDFYRHGRYGIVLEPFHKVFNQTLCIQYLENKIG
jgi:hypothetical protein